ncbi:phosphopantetheine-binding protein [Microbispora sp. NEAU-D428]|uniref:phosphopantetheine-binding protein n=1 Tax=Microbispora sitophila TaxID=2771537 RepID=UPI0018664054|nr:phosphopantetheine-binding protein [Microbispora sitophila]MBE3013927.1 phosphopantetheine-binding protein [Microbispora sitophila]
MDDVAILESIRRQTVAVVPEIDPAEITPDRSLADLGCNSVDRADIVTAVMEELAIEVPLSEFRQGAPVGELVELLRKHA